MPSFKIKYDKIDIEFDFKEKCILLSGDSGNGKSLLVNTISSLVRDGSNDEFITSDIPYYVIGSKNELQTVSLNVQRDGCALFIADEFIAHALIESVQNLNAYCLVVTRKIYTGISALDKALFTLINRDGCIMVKPVYLSERVNTFK